MKICWDNRYADSVVQPLLLAYSKYIVTDKKVSTFYSQIKHWTNLITSAA